MYGTTLLASNFQASILHMDMDAFFTSVEQRDHPELRGKPVIIGQSERGVAAAASYEARQYGVHSAMPITQARKLCPQGIFLPGRMARYKEVSCQVMNIIRDFCPVVEQASVDEAYADISGMTRLHISPGHMAEQLKNAILKSTGLTCSIGVAPNKFLAKICSDWEKPNGLTVLHQKQVPMFLASLPVSKIPGVGPRWQNDLHSLDVYLAPDVLRFSRDFWTTRYGQRGAMLHDRAQGIDPRPVLPHAEHKSCSAEHTLDADTMDRDILQHWLLLQAERVGCELRKIQKKGACVSLKLKFNDFSQCVRNTTLDIPTNTTHDIYAATRNLLARQHLSLPVRLIGTGVSHFRLAPGLLPVVTPKQHLRQQALDQALDSIRDKFGMHSIARADSQAIRTSAPSDLLSQKNKRNNSE
ncbi:DNA polymerase IV [Desulfovibrionales bacterium]